MRNVSPLRYKLFIWIIVCVVIIVFCPGCRGKQQVSSWKEEYLSEQYDINKGIVHNETAIENTISAKVNNESIACEAASSTEPLDEYSIESNSTIEIMAGSGYEKDVPEWCLTYAEHLRDDMDYLGCDKTQSTYSLIYLDEDDIPEIFISTGICAQGEFVLTYNNGKVEICRLERLGSEYIERSGFILTDTGHMGYYPVSITKLENGVFSEIASGAYTESEKYYAPDGSEIDYLDYLEWDEEASSGEPYSELSFNWEWMGEQVTEEEYNARIAEVFDASAGKYPVSDDGGYSYNGILKVIENGNEVCT